MKHFLHLRVLKSLLYSTATPWAAAGARSEPGGRAAFPWAESSRLTGIESGATPPAAWSCGEVADNVSSPENCEQVADWPRRKTSDFCAFSSSRVAAWTAQTPRSGVCHHSGPCGTRVFFAAMNIAARAVVNIYVPYSVINMVLQHSHRNSCFDRLSSLL